MSNNGKISWTTEKRRLGDLREWDKNPRQLSAHDAKHIKQSLETFGLADPLIINADNALIGGHQRKHILADPEQVVDVRVPSRLLTEREAEELAIRLNKNVGEWDWDALANGFEMDDLIEWGFSDKELLGLDFGNEPPEDPGAQLDRAEELREKWGVESGQLWQLGVHRLICGDCTDAAVVARVMQGEKAALTFTSPPYWVGKEYEQQKSVDEINGFILKSAAIIARFTHEDESRIVINTGTGFTTAFDKRKKRQVLLLIDKWTNAFWDYGWNLRHIRHWLKEGQLMSIAAKSDMIDQHCEWFGTFESDNGKELVFDDRIDQGEVEALLTYYNARGRGRGRGQESLGDYRNAKHWALRSYWDDITGVANQNNHCAAFPLQVVERHMVIYTKRGEITFEPFSGSGTTLIACERLKRIARCVEISAAYCAVAIQRWVDMTSGGEPVLMEGEHARA